MANFTAEIKEEIIDTGFREDLCIYALSAFIRTSGSVISHNGTYGFEIVSENTEAVHFFHYFLNYKLYPLTEITENIDSLSKRTRYSFESVGDKTTELLLSLGIITKDEEGVSIRFGIDQDVLDTEQAIESYIKGAFLGCGSCTLPDEDSSTGFHLEFNFRNKLLAEDFCDLLLVFEVLVKLIKRKDYFVVYANRKEVISDLLYLIVKGPCFEKFRSINRTREEDNYANRANNCSVSNIDKALTASVKQVQAIEVIKQTIGLKKLPEALFSVAMCRLADPSASMQELADRMNISKSCINHRMRKILDLASTLSQE